MNYGDGIIFQNMIFDMISCWLWVSAASFVCGFSGIFMIYPQLLIKNLRAFYIGILDIFNCKNSVQLFLPLLWVFFLGCNFPSPSPGLEVRIGANKAD